MTPLHAWLRGLSSDSCGPFRGAWATDAANAERVSPEFARALRYAYRTGRFPCVLVPNDADAHTDAIAAQRRAEVVGDWEQGGVE